MSADDLLSGSVEEDVVNDAPFGRCSSVNVTFAGTEMAHLDLTPPGASDANSSANATNGGIPPSLRDLSDGAVWSLTSAKLGHGVDQLRDGDKDTFWQSDGLLPHAITLQFSRKTRVSCVALYLDARGDESYTPARVAVRVGSGSAPANVPHELGGPDATVQDVREIERFDLEEPIGWIVVHLDDKRADDESEAAHATGVRCHFLQVVILGSHQSGRDTHVRQLRVFGPRGDGPKGIWADIERCNTVDMTQFACIR